MTMHVPMQLHLPEFHDYCAQLLRGLFSSSLSGDLQLELQRGYAYPLTTLGDATPLVFDGVDDHEDGNGYCALWMVHGSGTLYVQGQATAVPQGTIVVFDDCMEHAFSSDTGVCMAWNIPLLSPDVPAEWIVARFLQLAQDAGSQPLHYWTHCTITDPVLAP